MRSGHRSGPGAPTRSVGGGRPVERHRLGDGLINLSEALRKASQRNDPYKSNPERRCSADRSPPGPRAKRGGGRREVECRERVWETLNKFKRLVGQHH